MSVKYEIKRRMNSNDDAFSALGAEIKQHRLKQSMTLASVADSDFSISYLCKIERNQVKPSTKYLKEICEKVNISESKMHYLLNSNDLLKDAIKTFYYNDVLKQKEYEIKLDGLDNHRVILIRLIFNITSKDLVEAKKCINELLKLTANLANVDLMVFATFFGIYQYLNHNYLEAVDYLKLGLESNIYIKFLRPIQLGYLTMCAIKTFSVNTSKYYRDLEEEMFVYGASLNLDKAHYNMAIYYLLLNQKDSFNRVIYKISDIKIINTLEMLYAIHVNDENSIKTFSEDKMDEITKASYYIYHLSNKTIDFIDSLDIDLILKDYLKYQYLKQTDIEKSYNFLCDVAFKNAIKYLSSYLTFYYLGEIVNSFFRTNKYKYLVEMYNECMNVSTMVNSI